MKIKKTIFLSHIINERIPIYGGLKSVVFKKVKSIKNGDSCNTMHWSFPNHMGTHIDVPLHFSDNCLSISELSPQDLIFNKVKMINIEKVKPGHTIGLENIKSIEDCDLLLIRTYFEKHRSKDIYWKNSPALDSELAGWLKEKCLSLRAIGIDFISVSNWNNRKLGRDAHKAFLGNHILLIEDMKLGRIKKVPDLVIVAPLLVEKADGSPCIVLGIYN